jgi:hypothetical protein
VTSRSWQPGLTSRSWQLSDLPLALESARPASDSDSNGASGSGCPAVTLVYEIARDRDCQSQRKRAKNYKLFKCRLTVAQTTFQEWGFWNSLLGYIS